MATEMKSEDYAEAYWEGGVGSEYHNYADDPGWRGILYEASIHLPPFARVRELGSAHGYFLHHALKAFSYDAQGIDISEYATSKGMALMPHLVGRLSVANVANGLPWPDEDADMVFSSEFLEHMTPEALDSVLAEMYRVLKPGGLWLHKIGIVVPDNHPFRQPTVEDHSAHFTHYTVKTREEWIATFEGMGLVENKELNDALDTRFANIDWVMRFFAFNKE